MINMNIRPPRETADRNVDSVPKVKARMRKSGSRNIGSVTRRSIATNAISEAAEAASKASTLVLPQPIGCPPAGRMP